MAPNWQEIEANYRREQILAFAKSLTGAHYLWGADGSRPGCAPVAYADVVLDAGRLDATTFCAATITVANVKYVCAGRFRALPAKGSPLPGIIGIPEADRSLAAFVERYAHQSKSFRTMAQHGWGFELTPRLVKGNDIIDYGASGKPHVEGKVVWGEGCDDTRHFDCGSFVRFVAKEVCGQSIRGITTADLKNTYNGLGCVLADEVKPGDIMKPADILSYAGHVAFATEGGMPYDRNATYNVAQAESAVYGVNFGKPHAEKSIKCIRLSNSTLLGKKL